MPENDEALYRCKVAEGFLKEVHVQSDYGDENTRRTPWELFDRTDAQKALNLAEEAVRLAKEII